MAVRGGLALVVRKFFRPGRATCHRLAPLRQSGVKECAAVVPHAVTYLLDLFIVTFVVFLRPLLFRELRGTHEDGAWKRDSPPGAKQERKMAILACCILRAVIPVVCAPFFRFFFLVFFLLLALVDAGACILGTCTLINLFHSLSLQT